MERDVSELQALQRRLGHSLGWIVDTLLLDETNVKDEEQTKTLQNRKRDALESLAYVRDIMKGSVNPSEIEEDRLISEEEGKKRRAKAKQEAEASDNAATAPGPQMPIKDRLAVIPSPPLPAAALPSPSVDSRSKSAGWRSTTDYFATPSASLPRGLSAGKLPSSSLRHVSPPSTSSPSPSILTPNSNNVAMAPWHHTKSSFSSTDSSLTGLPRLPPKSSMTLHPNHGSPRPPLSFSPPVQTPPETTTSRDQPPRRDVSYDPLGAIS